MKPEDASEMLADAARELAEHFDAVQIMVSWTEGGLNYSEKRGVGDWYARQGLAHEFIDNCRAQQHAREISFVMPKPEPPEEGDQWKAEK